MTTREEILTALGDHPAGLTSAELAPLCPAADYDQFIVARVIAQLRSEKIISGAPAGPRDGHTVFVLNGRTLSPPASAPATPAAPTTEQKETSMSTAKQILDALAKHGPLNTEGLRKHVKSEHVTTIAGQLARDGKLDVDQSLGRGKYCYSLPGAAKRAKASPSPEASPKARARRPAPAQARPPAPTNGAADFAITAGGLLSIRKDEQSVSLDPAEYAALRQFTERAEAIWKETI